MSNAPSRHFPRQELHLSGPRPPPLSLSKQSRKIRKQKAAPPLAPAAEPQSQRQQPPPPPVIIYTVSPKKIHVEPSEFMSIVQRLTGNTPPPPPSSSALRENGGGVVFPAAQPASNAQFSDGCVETSQNLLWNAITDSSHLMNTAGLHGNINQNNLMMNMASSSGFDAFNYLYDI